MHDQAGHAHDAVHTADDEPYVDPVIEVYKRDIDQTILDANLRLTPDQRLRNLEAFVRDLHEIRGAMYRAKAGER